MKAPGLREKRVYLPAIEEPIQRSPGFAKKGLATYKLDLMGRCGMACLYCSSDHGNYLRIKREPFADETEKQLGQRLYPVSRKDEGGNVIQRGDPSLTFVWPDVLEKLRAQIRRRPSSWGRGETLVVSQLTDAFSGEALESGTTRAALRDVLADTSFRIRVVTKNAVVGTGEWIDFFRAHPGRFVVGLSTGTMDDAWARKVELGTSPPSDRIAATQELQAAGVPTFGMLCPVFPDVMHADQVRRLLTALRAKRCENVWWEPYNDRNNADVVMKAYQPGSAGRLWMERVYVEGKRELWSDYATALYLAVRDVAESEGWLDRAHYLLYEDGILARDAALFTDLRGVLLQSKPAENGRSRNQAFAEIQARLAEVGHAP